MLYDGISRSDIPAAQIKFIRADSLALIGRTEAVSESFRKKYQRRLTPITEKAFFSLN
jgi:hypothetical protein